MILIYSNFNIDIIKYISLNFDNVKDMISFITSTKLIYNYIDDMFFRDFAYKLYTKEFWIVASYRPPLKSKPLETMYKELLRIEQFQINQKKSSGKRWSNNQFYDYWKFNDES